jgi:hypothetical protein
MWQGCPRWTSGHAAGSSNTPNTFKEAGVRGGLGDGDSDPTLKDLAATP